MLDLKLKKLFPDIDLMKDVELVDDGKGPYIKEWNYSEPQPTAKQLAAMDVSAEAASAEAIRNRKISYPRIADQLDALLKQFKFLKDNDVIQLVPEMEAIVLKHQAVKKKYPKTRSG